MTLFLSNQGLLQVHYCALPLKWSKQFLRLSVHIRHSHFQDDRHQLGARPGFSSQIWLDQCCVRFPCGAAQYLPFILEFPRTSHQLYDIAEVAVPENCLSTPLCICLLVSTFGSTVVQAHRRPRVASVRIRIQSQPAPEGLRCGHAILSWWRLCYWRASTVLRDVQTLENQGSATRRPFSDRGSEIP